MKRKQRRLTKILPNNSPLAVAARGGEVLDRQVGPSQAMREFEPWSRDQPAYMAWFRKEFETDRCQCPDLGCGLQGEQAHHEEFGCDKDDRTLVWMSLRCHAIRHSERGIGGISGAWYATHCRAVAGDNWRSYCDSLEP
ncbi:MAG: hypothetical protein O7G84_13545 [Gammaproteobacteria bacterium]|nr:hypothetical protein [Gammaproteobacteria bacterium]